MNIRAVIFDIYGTLLQVGPPPPGADAVWERLWRDRLKTSARLNLAQFSAACDRVIAREHEAARARGILHPEIFWPEVVREVLPEIGPLSLEASDDFLYGQARLWHSVRLPAEVAEALRAFSRSGLRLGVASNAQPYTERELAEALAGAGLARAIFTPALCFWSYAHGFSKPDPHVFQILNARLAALGIAPGETLMVGDRLDNDIEPAKAAGWHTWQVGSPGDVDWAGLRTRLSQPDRKAL